MLFSSIGQEILFHSIPFPALKIGAVHKVLLPSQSLRMAKIAGGEVGSIAICTGVSSFFMNSNNQCNVLRFVMAKLLLSYMHVAARAIFLIE